MQSALIKKDIANLTEQLEELPTAYVPPVNHYFTDGMYCRETFTHAGTMLVGATHKKSCFNILTEGIVVVSNGEVETKVKAPQIFVSSPGSQKLGYCLTDTIMVNVFNVEATTVEEAEKELYEEDLGVLHANADYKALLVEFKYTEEMAQKDVQADNVIETTGDFELKPSKINGIGVFATKDLPKGTELGLAKIGDKRTTLGRWVNHSNKKNSQVIDDMAVTLQDIPKGAEILYNYRDTLKGLLCQEL